MKKFLIVTLLCMVLAGTMVPAAFAAGDTNYTQCMAVIKEQRTVQDQAHKTAQALRKQGYKDSSAYVQAAKSTYQEASQTIQKYQRLAKYSDEDIRILSTAVYHEAGTTTEQLRQYVAQVVLNRLSDSRFPDTIKEIITQPGQYSTKYASPETTKAIQAKDAKNGTNYYATCKNSVKQAMMGQVGMPTNVLYQANFTQGKGVWKSVHFDSGWYASTSYFCYG